MPPQQSVVISRRSLENVSIWALIATIVVAIFIFIPSSATSLVTTKTFVLAAGAFVTFAVYILARLGRGNIIFPSSILIGVLWLPVIAYALSVAFSGVPFTSAVWGLMLETDTLGFLLIATVLGTLAALVLRRSEHYRSFLRAGGIVFCAVAILEMLIIIIGQFTSKVSPTFSIVGSFNDLAFLLGLGIVGVLITLRFLELKERTRRVLVVCSIGALALLAIANSSVVWVLLAVVSLGLFVEAVMQRGPKASDADLDDVGVVGETLLETDESNHSIVLPLFILAASLFFFIGGTLGGVLANSLHINTLSVSPSWQSTFSVARNVYATAPVFGSGPGTFGVEWLKYRDTSLNSTVFWDVDFSSGIGFIPTSFVTTGLVGMIAWIAFFALIIILGLRMLLVRTPQDAFIRFVAILSFVASLYLFAVAIFALPNAIILVLAFVFTGLFVSTIRFAQRGRQWGVIFSRSPRIGFVIVFSLTILLLASVAAAYALVNHYIATTELSKARVAFSAGNLDSADKATKSSISFASSAAAYLTQSSIANARLNQIVTSTTLSAAEAQQAFQTALSSGINAALTATQLEPSNYQNWLALGNLYAQAVPLGVSGAYDNAKSAYNKAKVLNPTNPQILYILAKLDIENKNIPAAKEDLKMAIALKQDYTAAIFLLSQLEVQDGNVKEALAAALAAAYFTPNNPDILFQVGILYAASNDFANAITALSLSVTANPQFANARYFLSAVYVKQGDFKNALAQMQAIADMSSDNAKAVTTQLAALAAGKNPFPANLLSVSSAPVK